LVPIIFSIPSIYIDSIERVVDSVLSSIRYVITVLIIGYHSAVIERPV
jgi:hypothetical protein